MRADPMAHSSFADAPPAWARDVLGPHDPAPLGRLRGRLSMQVARGADFTLLTAVIADAEDLLEDALREHVRDAYDAILAAVDAAGQHAVRFWNYIPGLHARMGSGLDRYMVFNSGRFLAYSERTAGARAFVRALPTSSGVGSASPALTIHCLAGPTAGRPVEHARQIPAYRYSFRYGPHPPCFARATLVAVPAEPRHRLLVGGTASVRGEDSMHLDRLGAQLDETLVNLASIVTAAKTAAANGSGAPSPDAHGAHVADALARFTDLRVYLPRIEDGAETIAHLAPRFPGVAQVELVKADLCRRELLVEIEGVAVMNG